MNLPGIRKLLTSETIPEAAKATGLSVRTLWRIKAGAENITLATLCSLQRWGRDKKAAKK